MPSREDTIKRLILDLKRDELYFYNDNRCFEFIKANPENNDPLIVNEKISAMNNGVIENEDIPAFAANLLSLPVDEALEKGDLEIVSQISAVNEKEPHAFRKIASIFCNFHRPEIYPVQTYIAEELMELYCKKIVPEAGLPDNILPYLNFSEITDHFTKYYGFDSFNYYELEKFLWLNARRIREYFKNDDRDARFSSLDDR
ncbi:MAG: hypothetical protein P8X57_01975 [Cyclobacteriaceae bacterium]